MGIRIRIVDKLLGDIVVVDLGLFFESYCVKILSIVFCGYWVSRFRVFKIVGIIVVIYYDL